MKNEKGVTLIALIVYVIMMTLIIAGVSAVTASFRSNINEYDSTTESVVAFTKLNMYLIKDIKSKDAKIVPGSIEDNGFQLQFTDQKGNNETVKYSVQNNMLYRNSVKICDDIKQAAFSKGEGVNSITISLQFKNNYTRSTTYAVEGSA